MGEKGRTFLIPMAAAVAALSAGSVQTDAATAPASDAGVDQSKLKLTDVSTQADAQRLIYAVDDALHSLLLARNGQGALFADHESHYSHSSHSSHSSHYSGN